MLKVVDVTLLSNAALREIVVSHGRRGLTSSAFALAALRELEIRISGGLDFDKSFKLIESAARDVRPVRYREIAEASGVAWEKVGGQVEVHLSRLADYARSRGWPTPSVVVIKETAAKGLAPMNGLFEAAKAFGYVAPDEDPFLRAQHEKLAKWA